MKNIFTFICSIIFFCAINVSAQTGNMWTEIPYGQNLNCVHADGDYVYFGADFGIVKYNRLTGTKQNITFFNGLHDFIFGINDNVGMVPLANFPEAITTDPAGNLYVMFGPYLYKYDGFVWINLGYIYSSYMEVDYFYLKCIDNKIWIYANNAMGGLSNSITPVNYFDIASNTVFDFSAIGNYYPLTINNDGTLWCNDPNYFGGSGDSSHIVRTDLSGNVLDERYINADFNFSNYNDFLISNSTGDLFYMNPNNELCNDNGISVSTYSMPFGNYYFVKQGEFDPMGNLYLMCDASGYGNFQFDNAPLLTFDGSAVTEFSDVQIGSPYHRFSAMDFDTDGNLWLTCYEHNNRSVQENVFKKTNANVWTSFYSNDQYLPGTHYSFYNSIGTDQSGNGYYCHDNCISIIDSNLNTSVVQFYDSLTSYGLNYNYYITAITSAVSANGTVWLVYQNPYRLYKIQNGVSTYYTNFPDSGNFSIVAASNSTVYFYHDPYASQYDQRIYSFDGSNWQLIPLTGLPANTVLYNETTYDAQNNKFFYTVYDTTGINQMSLVSWDGATNTVYSNATLLWYNNYSYISADDAGNLWVLSYNGGTADSTLIKWDGTTSYYYTPPLGIYFNLNYYDFVSTTNGHVIFKGLYYDPFSYIESEAVFDFDGTNFSVHILPDNVNFYQDNMNINNFTSRCMVANGKYLFELANEIVVYDPDGAPNLPGASYNTIAGNVYYDLNFNNLYDAGDMEAQGIAAMSDNYSAISDWGGNFEIHTDTGMQHIHVANPPYYIPSPAAYNHDFHDSVALAIDHIDFVLQPIPGINDLTVDVSSWGFRPGHNGYYYLHYKNAGTTTQNGLLTLVYDNQLNFTGASMSPTSVNGNMITWNVGSLAPFADSTIYVSMWVDSSMAIGTALNSVMQITPVANDTTPLNNLVNYSHVVMASWDPNEKSVSPFGVGASNIIDTTQELTYTIFFQNTGTDTAFNITVFDTLDANVDLGTFKLISSSHAVQFYFQNPNILKFVFNNIFLPDSNVNEPGSHGFVKYSIKPKSGVQYGNTIQNTGYIYFDYNLPVVTNTTLNTLGDPLSVFELSNGNQLQLILYPNPNTGVFAVEISSSLSYQDLKLEITDCSGRILKSNSFTSNKTEVDCKNFAAGIYFVKVLSGDKILGTAKYVLMM